MTEVGVISEDERFELIKGDFVVMAEKGYAHEIVKQALVRAVVLAAPPDVHVGVEMTVQFAEDILLEPDIVLFPQHSIAKSNAGFVTAERGACVLAIEVAASSLGYDKGLKAELHANLGVHELWVVDANERVTWVHTGPSDQGWSSIVERGPNEMLTTPALPNFSIRLADID
jgi:Uma2 family endonuclease